VTKQSRPNAFNTQISHKQKKLDELEQKARIKSLDLDNKIKSWNDSTAWIQLVISITTALSTLGGVVIAGIAAYYAIHHPGLR
jgi:hypothetical protein